MPADNHSTVAKPGSRLRELGLVLPKAPTPLGAYVEASEAGSLLFLSGMLPVVNGKLSITGRLGGNLSVEEGREAVRIAAMNALAVAPGEPAAGFAALEEIPAGRIVSYQPYWAARGHLLHLLNRKVEAQKAFTRAASLTDDPALREYLFTRAAGNLK